MRIAALEGVAAAGSDGREKMAGGAGGGTIIAMSEKKPKPLLARPAKVKCLRCDRRFKSPDRRRTRLCPKCRQRKR